MKDKMFWRLSWISVMKVVKCGYMRGHWQYFNEIYCCCSWLWWVYWKGCLFRRNRGVRLLVAGDTKRYGVQKQKILISSGHMFWIMIFFCSAWGVSARNLWSFCIIYSIPPLLLEIVLGGVVLQGLFCIIQCYLIHWYC